MIIVLVFIYKRGLKMLKRKINTVNDFRLEFDGGSEV
jgi:hypothetical protein